MMSDDMLSQDEIDALLRGTSDDNEEHRGTPGSHIVTEDYLDEMAIDALGEIGNISFGSSATALSALLNQKVDITTPTVKVVKASEISQSFPHPSVAINVQYTEGLKGTNLLVIKQSDAAVIADLMLGGNGITASQELDEIQLSAVQEAMNQMMGSAATSMSTIFNNKVDISPPSIDLMDLTANKGMDNLPNAELLIQISFHLKVGSLIDSSIMQLVPLEFGQSLIERLMSGSEAAAETAVSALAEAPQQADQDRMERPQLSSVPAYSTPSDVPDSENEGIQLNRDRAISQPVNVQPAEFSSFDSPGLSSGESRNLNLLMDIPLQVTVELGRTKRSVRDILDLTSGSIIELDKLAGEPVDILVNNRLIAQGEVVVIDENFGVRLTDIVSQKDRLTKLK
ncbi:flagellar motor switch phosphatase FliY [Jeotgalibacillus sp. ET6]|uniref:flagellar motor switch phosphatase FliY n=1 Tax=Jeotgalibacillus sp. ET6 TaxID=3037260 RepID=UPI002418B7C2|nr:flagellar motor switch phosphatase FliY [Jeotgalibacillus sp. ET6]MDG5470299.1 flagellar motor switch phosphatase FliY [Jeotgalibacillus sp. ET6]